MTWVAFLIAALGIGLTYAVMAVGIVLIYRTSRVLAFHFGEIGMLAAYVMVSAWRPEVGTHDSGLLSGVIAALAVSLVAGLILYGLVEKLGGRFGHFIGTVVTIAAAIILVGLMSLFWGAETYPLPLFFGAVAIGGASVSISSLGVVVIAAATLIVTGLIITHSTLGIDMQAIACNPPLACLRGIPVQRTICGVWIISTVLAAIAGILTAAVSVVSMDGAIIGVSAVVAAIIGGLTSVRFCIIGALLLAACETSVVMFFDPRYSQVIPVLTLLLLLIVKPSGLSGRTENIERV